MDTSETERRGKTSALLCREARSSAQYAELLGLALRAGLATERQRRWIEDTGLARWPST